MRVTQAVSVTKAMIRIGAHSADRAAETPRRFSPAASPTGKWHTIGAGFTLPGCHDELRRRRGLAYAEALAFAREQELTEIRRNPLWRAYRLLKRATGRA